MNILEQFFIGFGQLRKFVQLLFTVQLECFTDFLFNTDFLDSIVMDGIDYLPLLYVQ